MTKDADYIMTAQDCQRNHRPLYWMMGTILAIVSGMALTMGYDVLASAGAKDAATEVRSELHAKTEATIERDKAVADKLQSFRAELDRRFEALGKALERINDKLDKQGRGARLTRPTEDHEASIAP